SALVRTKASSFSDKETITFSEIQQAKELGNIEELLYPLQRGIGEMERVEVDEETRTKIHHGNKLPTPSSVQSFPFAFVSKQQLLAIYDQHPTETGIVKPIRVFNT